MATTSTEIADRLVKGAVIRFQNSSLSERKLTVRLVSAADVAPVESGTVYAVLCGYRVRPVDLSVSFGERKVYCVNVDRIEIIQEA